MRMPLGLLFGSVLLAGAVCATGPAGPPSVNVTGQWVGTWSYENPSVGTGDIRGTFQQDGDKVSGYFNITGPVVNRVAIVTGTLSGNEIRLSGPRHGLPDREREPDDWSGQRPQRRQAHAAQAIG